MKSRNKLFEKLENILTDFNIFPNIFWWKIIFQKSCLVCIFSEKRFFNYKSFFPWAKVYFELVLKALQHVKKLITHLRLSFRSISISITLNTNNYTDVFYLMELRVSICIIKSWCVWEKKESKSSTEYLRFIFSKNLAKS